VVQCGSPPPNGTHTDRPDGSALARRESHPEKNRVHACSGTGTRGRLPRRVGKTRSYSVAFAIVRRLDGSTARDRH